MKQSLNNGILTAGRAAHVRRIVRHQSRHTVTAVPLWKAIMVTIALCAMSSSYAYSVRPDPITITKIRTVQVDHPVPACKPPASLTRMKGYRGMQSQLAAAVPASALKPWGK